MEDAKCLQCLSDKQLAILAAQLLCEIYTEGGIGNLTGAIDPNGVVAGDLGQIYTQVVGTVTTLWINTDGGTTWV